jgi:esterase
VPPAVLASFTFGTGPHGVVLLHGFLGSGRNLRTMAQRWSERAPGLQILVPDLRGHGQSPPLPADGAPLADLAGDVLATAEAQHLPTPFSVVGHSLGGRVALAAARRAPALISEVTLLDIGPGRIAPATSETRRVLDVLREAPAEASDRRGLRAFFIERGLSPALSDWLLMNLHTTPGRVHWAIDREALAGLHDRSMAEDLWPVIEAHEIPVRLIYGGRSKYVPPAELARLQAAGVPVAVLPDAGHFVHVDALPELLDELGKT